MKEIDNIVKINLEILYFLQHGMDYKVHITFQEQAEALFFK